MLERVSAVAGLAPFRGGGVLISESPAHSLTQIAGDAKALKTAFPRLPETVGTAISYAGKTILRIGPQQLWVIGTAPDLHEGLFVTPLSSSRTCFLIEGTSARDVLAACAAIDFHPHVFKPEKYVMTGIHHMPVLIHCASENQFQVYCLRTFALHLWEVLTDAAHS